MVLVLGSEAAFLNLFNAQRPTVGAAASASTSAPPLPSPYHEPPRAQLLPNYPSAVPLALSAPAPPHAQLALPLAAVPPTSEEAVAPPAATVTATPSSGEAVVQRLRTPGPASLTRTSPGSTAYDEERRGDTTKLMRSWKAMGSRRKRLRSKQKETSTAPAAVAQPRPLPPPLPPPPPPPPPLSPPPPPPLTAPRIPPATNRIAGQASSKAASGPIIKLVGPKLHKCSSTTLSGILFRMALKHNLEVGGLLGRWLTLTLDLLTLTLDA